MMGERNLPPRKFLRQVPNKAPLHHHDDVRQALDFRAGKTGLLRIHLSRRLTIYFAEQNVNIRIPVGPNPDDFPEHMADRVTLSKRHPLFDNLRALSLSKWLLPLAGKPKRQDAASTV